MSTEQDPTETTPLEVAHLTTGSGMTSSSSRGAGFYFQCAVLVVAVVGAAANGLVVYAMVAAKQHTKRVLIFNQNALDLVNCLFLAVEYSVKLCDVYLRGTAGHWLCLVAAYSVRLSGVYLSGTAGRWLCLVVAYSVKLSGVYLSGTAGRWLCLTILSDAGNWATYVGSLINLCAISIERYLKIVHNAWAKKYLRNWMIL